jgi:hypothetical protein
MKYFYILAFIFLAQISLSGQLPNWVSPIKGDTDDYVSDVVTDAAGNVYSVGRFLNFVDFDPGPQNTIMNTLTADKGNLFVVKYSPAGNLIWAKQIGGDKGVSVNAVDAEYLHPKIALDGLGNFYITGLYDYRMDLDPSPSSTFFLSNIPGIGATYRFVGKYTTNGEFVWAKRIGGTDNLGCVFNNMKVDNSGNIYFAGNFWNTVDFDPGAGTFNLTSDNNYDIFFMKLDTNGNFIWAKKLGNPNQDEIVKKMVIDNQNLYITGSYMGTVDFDPQNTVSNLQSVGNTIDGYIAKFSLSDGTLQWAKSYGSGVGGESGYAIQVDVSGNVYASGHFKGTVDFDSDPVNTAILTNTGTAYATYFLKLSSSGQFIWVKRFIAMGSLYPSEQKPYEIAVKGNTVYLAGYYLDSMDCNPDDSQQFLITANGGNYDMFVIALNTNGVFSGAKSYGGTLHDYLYTMAIDNNEDIIIGGKYSQNVNFDPSVTSVPVSGIYDGFTLKLNKNLFLKTSEFSQRPKFEIYPNPTINSVMINSELPIINVNIYSIDGKFIFTKNTDGKFAEIDLKHLNSGIYLLHINTVNRTYVEKIIKK